MLQKQGDKLDKYRSHLIKGTKISDKAKESLERMTFVNSLLCEGYSRNKIANLIQNRYEISQRQAYTLVTDTIQLFGDVTKSSKEGKRYLMGENFLRLAKKAEAEGKLDIAQACLDKFAKLFGLYETTDVNIDLTAWLRPTNIIFTDNPQALTQETEYENIYDDIHKSETENVSQFKSS